MRTLLVFLFLGATVLAVDTRAPRERAFSFEYAVAVNDIPAGAHTVDIWLPQPHSDAFQRITNMHVDTPARYETTGLTTTTCCTSA